MKRATDTDPRPSGNLRPLTPVLALVAMACLTSGQPEPELRPSQPAQGIDRRGPAAAGDPGTTPLEVRRDVMVPMSDGVRLAADIYLPEGTGPFPVLLSRTPYDKARAAGTARFYAENGYAVVLMDSRGLRASEGEWRPYIDEGKDGYETQEWIADQPWCDGNIGMFGTSYPAFTQLLPAPYRSPFVKALVPVAAQSDNFGSVWSTDGLYHLATGVSWGTRQESIATGQPMPPLNWMSVMNQLPIRSAMDRVGIHSEFVARTLEHQSYDDFWRQMSIRHQYAEMDVPALHVTGWYDDLTAETILNYTSMRELSRTAHARTWQRLLIGPWGHGVNSDPTDGAVDFGGETDIDARALHLRWFNHHLKGIDDGLESEAPVRIFVMGDNVWRDEQEWPLARARDTRFFLRSDGAANTRFGDGTLSLDPPEDEPSDQYRYDPRNPVPTFGGHGCCGAGVAPTGALDQRSTQQRHDILVYTTEALTEDTEVTGAPEVRLFFSTDVPDTDFFATLSDVHPDGRAIEITEGAIRARFRDSQERPTPVIPGETYEVAIRMWETSNVFKEGHRIRLHITSSNFPRFNRNLNSGKPLSEETEADLRVATQTVLHDSAHPSAIVLPVIP